MKKKIQIIALLFLATLAIAQDQDTEAFTQFIGDWSGEGYFYNINVQSELGPVRFTLRITPEMGITGTAGHAEIIDAEIKVDNWNDGYMIKATLQGKIDPRKDFEKKRITLLLNKVNNDITEGDFHFANNFIFDFSMRPGSITLQRNP